MACTIASALSPEVMPSVLHGLSSPPSVTPSQSSSMALLGRSSAPGFTVAAALPQPWSLASQQSRLQQQTVASSSSSSSVSPSQSSSMPLVQTTRLTSQGFKPGSTCPRRGPGSRRCGCEGLRALADPVPAGPQSMTGSRPPRRGSRVRGVGVPAVPPSVTVAIVCRARGGGVGACMTSLCACVWPESLGSSARVASPRPGAEGPSEALSASEHPVSAANSAILIAIERHRAAC